MHCLKSQHHKPGEWKKNSCSDKQKFQRYICIIYFSLPIHMNHNFFPILSPVRLRIDMRVPAFPNAVRTPAPTFSTLHRSALFLIVWDAHLCTTCCFFLPFSFVHIAVTPLPEFQPQPILCPRVSSYSHLPFATARAATHSHMSHEDIIPHTGH